MPRTIITTCGTSLLKSCCWKYADLSERHLSQMKDEKEKIEYQLECNTILKEVAKKREPYFYKQFNRFSWDNVSYIRDLPAELASLRAMQLYFEKINKPLEKDDKLILLSSDNDEGEFCSKIIHNILTNCGLLNEVTVELLKIEGLDTRKSENFVSALQTIWVKIVRISDRNNIEYIFNLTGGYKGVAILFGGAAYLLSKVNIFYLHEDTNLDFGDISIFHFDKTECNEKRFSSSIYNAKEDIITKSNDTSFIGINTPF